MVIIYIIIILIGISIWLTCSLIHYSFVKKKFLPLFEYDANKTNYFISSLSTPTFFKLGKLLHGQKLITPEIIKDYFDEQEYKSIISKYISFLNYEN